MTIRTTGRRAAAAVALALGASTLLGGPAAFAAPVDPPTDSSPVTGNIDFDRAGSVAIHKHITQFAGDEGAIDSNDDPITSPVVRNATFSLYKITDLDLSDPAAWEHLAAYTAVVEQVASTIPGDNSTTPVLKVYPPTLNEDGEVVTSEGGTPEPNKEVALTIEEQNTALTDANGVATFSSLPVAAYVVWEPTATGFVDTNGNGTREPDEHAVAKLAAPFIVTVPTPNTNTDDAGNTVSSEWVYDVNAFPKDNSTLVTKHFWDPVQLQKVNSSNLVVENPGFGAGVVDGVRWQIEVKLPEEPVESFIVTDVVSESLRNVHLLPAKTYTGSEGRYINPVHVGSRPDENALNGIENLYEFSYDADSRMATFAFTEGGINFINRQVKSVGGLQNSVFINLVATLDGNYVRGNIENDAIANINGIEITSNTAATTFGAVEVQKVDEAKKPLAGAKFKLYNAQNPYAETCAPVPAEVKPSGVGAEPVDSPVVINGQSEFISNEEGMIEGLDGIFVSTGNPNLPNGLMNPGGTLDNPGMGSLTRCYVLEEVAAPAGFVLPKDGAQYTAVRVSSQAPDADAPVAQVINTTSRVPELPLTGAQGQVILVSLGAGLLAVSAGLVIARRRATAK